ncbi:MAG: PepSY-like domain-containing protein [Bacteroidota bacterium]
MLAEKMKQGAFIATLTLSLGLIACDPTGDLLNHDLTEIFLGEISEISPEDLPGTVTEYLDRTYNKPVIEGVAEIEASDGNVIYATQLQGRGEVLVSRSGAGCDAVALDNLPQAIQTYVSQQFPEEVILRAASVEKDGETIYIVKLSSGEVLAFDSRGTFLFEKMRGRKGGKYGRSEMLEAAELPVAMVSYIENNYPNETIARGLKLALRDGTILFAYRTEDGTKLFFDENGNYLEGFSPSWRK